jgi:hypothetical protein
MEPSAYAYFVELLRAHLLSPLSASRLKVGPSYARSKILPKKAISWNVLTVRESVWILPRNSYAVLGARLEGTKRP